MVDKMAVSLMTVIMTPYGFGLFLLNWILFISLLIVLFRTPALLFLVASLRKSIVVINPGEDRVLRFQRGKKMGSLIYVKRKDTIWLIPMMFMLNLFLKFL